MYFMYKLGYIDHFPLLTNKLINYLLANDLNYTHILHFLQSIETFD
jgi:hypothetical protein